VATDIDSFWDYNDPAASEQRFRELLAKTTDRDSVLEIQTQIARAQGLQGKFDEAHKTLDAVVTNSPRVEVWYLLERGRVFNSSGQPDKARPLFLAAWEKAQAGKLDFFAVDAAHMIAIVESPDNALAWNEKALALAGKSCDPIARNWIGSLLNNLGWAYYDKKDYAMALDAFERDLAWFNERKLDERARIARYSIGKTLRTMGRVEEALAIQRELTKLMPDDNYVREEIAECLKQLAQAQPRDEHE